MGKTTSAFMGSGRFAARCLELMAGHIRPEWVLTNAPRAAGRGLKLQQTPVSELAEKLALPVFTTQKLSADAERSEWIKKNAPDVIFVIDFGHIIKEPVLSAPRYGCINIHPSRLPEYRGSAPVQRAIMDGRTSTAVSVFKLDSGMDSGPLLAQSELEISPSDTSSSLLEKAAVLGTETLLGCMASGPDRWKFIQQNELGASLAPKIEKSEGRVEWSCCAKELYDKIRAIGESPGVYCTVRGRRLRIYEAELVPDVSGTPGGVSLSGKGAPIIFCAEGALRLLSVQPEGKRIQAAEDWARGLRLTENEILE